MEVVFMVYRGLESLLRAYLVNGSVFSTYNFLSSIIKQ